MKITLDWLKEHGACVEGVKWFGLHDRDAKEVIESLIAEHKTNDQLLSWANLTIARLLGRKGKIKYAIFAAEQVIEIYEKKYPDDKRPRKAIETAKAVLKNDTNKNRTAATAAYATAAYAAYDDAATAARDKIKIKILRYGLKTIEAKK